MACQSASLSTSMGGRISASRPAQQLFQRGSVRGSKHVTPDIVEAVWRVRRGRATRANEFGPLGPYILLDRVGRGTRGARVQRQPHEQAENRPHDQASKIGE